jgi:DNA-binding CsgD family transcriptional regulator
VDLGAFPIEDRRRLLRLAEQGGLCSPRELETVTSWAEGVGFRRTAEELGLAESTVRTLRQLGLAKVAGMLLAGGAVSRERV